MNWQFVLIQMIGFFAWLMLALSYYRKDTNKILVFHMVGTTLYCIHYAFLGAWSGLFIGACETIFDLNTHSQISPVCKFKMGNLRNKKGSLCADIMETKSYLK